MTDFLSPSGCASASSQHLSPDSRINTSCRSFRLAPDIHCCHTGGTFVFLDLCRDRYACLTEAQAVLFQEFCQLSPDLAPGVEALSFGNFLGKQGILQASFTESDRIDLFQWPAPDRSLFDLDQVEWRFRVHRVPAMLGSMRAASAACHSGAFQDQITRARGWKSRSKSVSLDTSDVVADLAREFHTFAPFVFSTRDACRYTSLALLHYLSAAGLCADWVFGVRLSPFSAHCWLEFNGLLLTDETLTVREFTPIMAV